MALIKNVTDNINKYTYLENTSYYDLIDDAKYNGLLNELLKNEILYDCDNKPYLTKFFSKKIKSIVNLTNEEDITIELIKDYLFNKKVKIYPDIFKYIHKYPRLFNLNDSLKAEVDRCFAFIDIETFDDLLATINCDLYFLDSATFTEALTGISIAYFAVKKDNKGCREYLNDIYGADYTNIIIKLFSNMLYRTKGHKAIFKSKSSMIIKLLQNLPMQIDEINDDVFFKSIKSVGEFDSVIRYFFIELHKTNKCNFSVVNDKFLNNHFIVNNLLKGYTFVKYVPQNTYPFVEKMIVDTNGYCSNNSKEYTYFIIDVTCIKEELFKKLYIDFVWNDYKYTISDRCTCSDYIIELIKNKDATYPLKFTYSEVMNAVKHVLDMQECSSNYSRNCANRLIDFLKYHKTNIEYDYHLETDIKNLVATAPATPKTEGYSKDEINKLIAKCQEMVDESSNENDKDRWGIVRLLLVIFSNCTIRINSFLNATIDDIERHENESRFFYTFTGKTKRELRNGYFDYIVSQYVEQLLKISEKYRAKTDSYDKCMVLYINDSKTNLVTNFTGKKFYQNIKTLCELTNIKFLGCGGLRNYITESNLIESISRGFNDSEQVMLNGHSTVEQLRSYSTVNIIDLERKCFDYSIGEVDFLTLNDDYKEDLYVNKYLVNEGTGFCNKDCEYVNLNCMYCPFFHTTVYNLPAFLKLEDKLIKTYRITNDENVKSLLNTCQKFIYELRNLT